MIERACGCSVILSLVLWICLEIWYLGFLGACSKGSCVQVRDVMTRTTQCVRSDESVAEAARRIHEIGMTALPVCGESNDLVGTLTEEDAVASRAGHSPSMIHVSDIMR